MADHPTSLGIVVVDHGSRRDDANRQHEHFVEQWGAARGLANVEAAHMELAEPSIATAVDACVAAGATTVVVVPFFLGPGSHWDRDIPALAAAACRPHPGLRHLVTAPLGPHPVLGDIVSERIERCLAHAHGEAGACSMCAGSERCRLL